MPTKYRFNRADFKLFSSQNTRRLRGSFFTLAFVFLTNNTLSKVSYVVSKKVARRAVDRNQIKRQCREVLRPVISNTKQSARLVFYANTAIKKATFEELSEDVVSLLEKINITNSHGIKL